MKKAEIVYKSLQTKGRLVMMFNIVLKGKHVRVGYAREELIPVLQEQHALKAQEPVRLTVQTKIRMDML
jgi:hypothetical protein